MLLSEMRWIENVFGFAYHVKDHTHYFKNRMYRLIQDITYIFLQRTILVFHARSLKNLPYKKAMEAVVF